MQTSHRQHGLGSLHSRYLLSVQAAYIRYTHDVLTARGVPFGLVGLSEHDKSLQRFDDSHQLHRAYLTQQRPDKSPMGCA